MKKPALLFLLVLVYSLAFAQNKSISPYPRYYHLIREAKLLSKDGNSSLALRKFKEAIKTVKYVHTHNWVWAAQEAKKAGNCKLASKYIQKAVLQGHNNEAPHLTDDEYISNFLDCSDSNKKLKVGLLALMGETNRKINVGLKKYLDSLSAEDQKVRIDKSASKEEWIKIDSSNISALKAIISKYGYPDERLVGSETAYKIFFVVLHYDADINNSIMGDILFRAFQEGKISPQQYAWVVDRRLNWGPDKKDPYYFQLVTKKLNALTETEKKEVDKRRYSIGLKPLSAMNVIFKPGGGISIEEDWTDF